MTIQEAIQSGKPLKRRSWTIWCSINADDILIHEKTEHPLSQRPVTLYSEDILATDWETKD